MAASQLTDREYIGSVHSDHAPSAEPTDAHRVETDRGTADRYRLVLRLSAVLIVGILAILVVPRLGEPVRDTVFDWMTIHAVRDGIEYGSPIGALADHYGFDLLRDPSIFPPHDEWIHPRTPGSIALLAPLLFMDIESASAISRILAAGCWVLLAVALVPRIMSRRLLSVPMWMLMATVTAPVLMLLEFGPHLGLATLCMGVAWLLLRERDSLTGGLLVGLAMILRFSFGFALVGLVLGRRRRAAAVALAVWIGVESIAASLFRIDLSSVLEVGRAATVQWLGVVVNGSLLSQVSRSEVGPISTWLLATAVGCGIVAVIFRHRRIGIDIDAWLALASVAAVLASPVVWEQYLLALALPVAWGLAGLSRTNRILLGTGVVGSQIALLIVRVAYPQGPIRAWSISTSCLIAAAVVLARLWSDDSPDARGPLPGTKPAISLQG